MMCMAKFQRTVACVLTVLAPNTVLAEPTLRLGSFVIAPHIVQDHSHDVSGPLVDYLRYLDQLLPDASFSVQAAPLPRILRDLELNHIDAIPFLTKTEPRAARFLYAQQPFFQTTPALVTTDPSVAERIINGHFSEMISVGLYQDGSWSDILNHPNIELEPMSGENVDFINLQKLVHGRVHAVYSADLIGLQYHILANQWDSKVQLTPLPNESSSIYFVFSSSLDPALQERIQQVMHAPTTRPYSAFVDDFIAKQKAD